jgi:hypothetical protein
LGFDQSDPSEIHLMALKKVLRYLTGTLQMRMTLGVVPTTPCNFQAMRIQSRAMTRDNASHAPATL